jgi:hypothetical protein
MTHSSASAGYRLWAGRELSASFVLFRSAALSAGPKVERESIERAANAHQDTRRSRWLGSPRRLVLYGPRSGRGRQPEPRRREATKSGAVTEPDDSRSGGEDWSEARTRSDVADARRPTASCRGAAGILFPPADEVSSLCLSRRVGPGGDGGRRPRRPAGRRFAMWERAPQPSEEPQRRVEEAAGRTPRPPSALRLFQSLATETK